MPKEKQIKHIGVEKLCFALEKKVVRLSVPSAEFPGQKLRFYYRFNNEQAAQSKAAQVFLAFLDKEGYSHTPLTAVDKPNKSEFLAKEREFKLEISVDKNKKLTLSCDEENRGLKCTLKAEIRKKVAIPTDSIKPASGYGFYEVDSKLEEIKRDPVFESSVRKIEQIIMSEEKEKRKGKRKGKEEGQEARRVVLHNKPSNAFVNSLLNWHKHSKNKYMGAFYFDASTPESFQVSLNQFYKKHSGLCKIDFPASALNNKEAWFFKAFLKAYPNWLIVVGINAAKTRQEYDALLKMLPTKETGGHLFVVTEDVSFKPIGFQREKLPVLSEEKLPDHMHHYEYVSKLKLDDLKRARDKIGADKILRVCIPISVGQEHSRGQQFKSAVEAVERSMKDLDIIHWQCDIIIADTLQHYNRMVVDRADEKRKSEFLKASRVAGKRWFAENSHILEGKKNFKEIYYWDQCKNDDKSRYLRARKIVGDLYKNVPEVTKNVHIKANEFMLRRLKKQFQHIEKEEDKFFPSKLEVTTPKALYDAIGDKRRKVYAARARDKDPLLRDFLGGKLNQISDNALEYILEELTLVKYVWRNFDGGRPRYEVLFYPGAEAVFSYEYEKHKLTKKDDPDGSLGQGDMTVWSDFDPKTCASPSALFGIEAKQNVWFVPRKEEMEKVEAFLGNTFDSALKKRTKALYLTGAQGMGKTQLALAYYHGSPLNYNDRFWLGGRDIPNGLKRIGLQKGWISLDATEEEILSVKDKLADFPGWLLVIDNVIELKEISQYLPSKGGHIICTSNDSKPAHVETIQSAQLPITKMTQEQALAMVSKASLSGWTSEDAVTLVETLGRVPLLISQACAYLRCNEKATIKLYLKEYVSNKKQRLRDYPLLGSDHAAITASWQVLFNQIIEEHGEMRQLLTSLMRYCAYFNPNKIPVKFLIYSIPFCKSEKVLAALAILEQYSILSFDRKSNVITFHGTTLDIVYEEEREKKHLKSSILHQLRRFDWVMKKKKDDKPTLSELALFVPHVKHLIERSKSLGLDFEVDYGHSILDQIERARVHGFLEQPETFKETLGATNHQETMFFHESLTELLKCGVVTLQMAQEYTWLEINRLARFPILTQYFKNKPQAIGMLSAENEEFDAFFEVEKLSSYMWKKKVLDEKLESESKSSRISFSEWAFNDAIFEGDLAYVNKQLKEAKPEDNSHLPYAVLSVASRNPAVFFKIISVYPMVSYKKSTFIEILALRAPWSQKDKQNALRYLEGKGYKLQPEHRAAAFANIAELKALPVEGLVKTSKAGSTVMHFAAASGSVEACELISKRHPKSLSIKDKRHLTPLAYAIMADKAEVVGWFLKQHPESINERYEIEGGSYNTPFVLAAHNGRVDVLEKLYRVDPSILNESCSPGFNLFQISHPDVLEWLLDKDPLFIEKAMHSSGIKSLVNEVGFCNLRMLKFYLENKLLNPKEKDAAGMTVLLNACKAGNLAVVTFLLEGGHSSVWERNSSNQGPVHIAVKHGHVEILQWLQEANYIDLHNHKQRDAICGGLTRMAALYTQEKVLGWLASNKLISMESLRDNWTLLSYCELFEGLETLIADLSPLPPLRIDRSPIDWGKIVAPMQSGLFANREVASDDSQPSKHAASLK